MEYPCYEGSTVGPNDGEAAEAVECPCGDATKAEVEDYQDVKFWLEAVAVPAVGGVGLVCNLAAIPILLSRHVSEPRKHHSSIYCLRNQVMSKF